MPEYTITVEVLPMAGTNLKVKVVGAAFSFAPKTEGYRDYIAQEIEEYPTDARTDISRAVNAMRDRLRASCDKRARYLLTVDSYGSFATHENYRP